MSKEKTELGYSTKHALTVGIQAVKVTASQADPRYVYTVESIHGYRTQLIRDNTFWKTKGGAELRAMGMVEAKIKSLKRQIEKLERYKDCPKWDNK